MTSRVRIGLALIVASVGFCFTGAWLVDAYREAWDAMATCCMVFGTGAFLAGCWMICDDGEVP